MLGKYFPTTLHPQSPNSTSLRKEYQKKLWTHSKPCLSIYSQVLTHLTSFDIFVLVFPDLTSDFQPAGPWKTVPTILGVEFIPFQILCGHWIANMSVLGRWPLGNSYITQLWEWDEDPHREASLSLGLLAFSTSSLRGGHSTLTHTGYSIKAQRGSPPRSPKLAVLTLPSLQSCKKYTPIFHNHPF